MVFEALNSNHSHVCAGLEFVEMLTRSQQRMHHAF